jgi:diguanylate cyclase (GGDEF)-like protein
MPGDQLLLVDDDPHLLDLVKGFLEEQGYEVTAADGQQAREALKTREFALALLGLKRPVSTGLRLLSHIKTRSPDTEVILVTDHACLDRAVHAMGLGAYDYVVKSDLRLTELQALVARALERRRLARENRDLVQHMSKARKELTKSRVRELNQVRQIAETLAGPLTWDQLLRGLVKLIWDSLPLQILGLEIAGQEMGLPLEYYRRQPGVPDDSYQTVKDLLRGQLTGDRTRPAALPRRTPLSEMLWARVTLGNVTLAAGAGRQEPFSPEEAKLFRTLINQGKTGIKNLVLFNRVKSMAIRDALTGLYNYGYFREALYHEVKKSHRYKTPLTLLFLDIDDFKLINDTLGHLQGDEVLRHVAAILTEGIRQADLTCRYGGDEFVMLLSQTPPEQAVALAERLRRLIAESTMNPAVPDLKVTVSIGVAGLQPGMSMEDLLKAADDAHYRAKRAGKNRIWGAEGLGLAQETASDPGESVPRLQ